ALRGNELSGDVAVQLQDVSLTGTGRIALTPEADSELSFRFHDSPLDRYIRLFRPNFLPETTGAKVSGSVRVMGELANLDHLAVDATIDALELQPYDYQLRNAEPIHVTLEDRTLKIPNLKLVGESTELSVSGEVGLRDERIHLAATGSANLGILQIFSRNILGSGRAELRASVDGPLRAPVFSGSAIVTNGRIRDLRLPNALDMINGAIRFDARGIQFDEVTASLGGGPVQFGGRIGLEGYLPGELNVLIMGKGMHLRYPEGIQSTVDVDLTVRGNVQAPVVGGVVTVQSAVWTRELNAPGSILDLVSRSSSAGDAASSGPEIASTVPIRFDIEIKAPSAFRMNTNLITLVASADLNLRGTYDKPVLLGRADVDRGQLNFEGRRYRVTRGSVSFTNPTRIEPFIDVEGETSVRVPGQTYRVIVSATGTPGRLDVKLDSDPPLAQAEVAALLLGGAQVGPLSPVAPELQRLQNPNLLQTEILQTRATQALSSPISSEVGRVVQQTFGVDTFQVSPSFTDPNALSSRLNPTARVTIGKQISDRAYLTFSRSLNSTVNDQILQLEYDVSDRFYWVFSRNEDSQTWTGEFRVRHSF
ncbi:MAG TPA: translocation/assembly module TamB domain-containing protein, partial [Vicinamibacterales bacterium]|nr:translocation/assembly module TamB domain-containing protein [Vicinamibacterales bacterium]